MPQTERAKRLARSGIVPSAIDRFVCELLGHKRGRVPILLHFRVAEHSIGLSEPRRPTQVRAFANPKSRAAVPPTIFALSAAVRCESNDRTLSR